MDRDLLYTVACDQAAKQFDFGCDILCQAYFEQQDQHEFVHRIFRAVENEDGARLLAVFQDMMNTLIDIPQVASFVERDHYEYMDYLDGKLEGYDG